MRGWIPVWMILALGVSCSAPFDRQPPLFFPANNRTTDPTSEITLTGNSSSSPAQQPVAALARDTGISAVRIETLAAGMELDLDPFFQALETGLWEGGATSAVTMVRLEQAFATVRQELTREEMVALLEHFTGMNLEQLQGWFSRHGSKISRNGDGSISVAEGLAVLKSIRDNPDGSVHGYGGVEFYGRDAGPPFIPSDTAVLFDGTLGAEPSLQGWLFFPEPPNAVFGQEVTPNGIRLSTGSDSAVKAGYFSRDPFGIFLHPRQPALDHTKGFFVRIQVRVLEEGHVRTDRSGVSFLMVCDDLSALEIGLWLDRIWVQSDRDGASFEESHAEEAVLDLTQWTELELLVSKTEYALRSSGRIILRGRLRNYSAHPGLVYRTPGLLFLGDNTTSARGVLEWARLETGPLSALDKTSFAFGGGPGEPDDKDSGPGFQGFSVIPEPPPPEKTQPQAEVSTPQDPSPEARW